LICASIFASFTRLICIAERFPDAFAGVYRSLRQFGGAHKAEFLIMQGRQPDGALGIHPAALPVGLNAAHAFFLKAPRRIGQRFQRFEQRICDVRRHHVQFQLPRRAAVDNRRIVAEDMKADHVEHLGHDRIDLARHDRRTWLYCGQFNLVQPGVRPGTEQPQIIGDFAQFHCDAA
jgi:hypothetical protein